MFESVLSFLDRHQSFILTTHDYLDADGLGSELVLASVLKKAEKEFKIINPSNIPATLEFLVTNSIIEKYDKEKHSPFFDKAAILILDNSNDNYLGSIKNAMKHCLVACHWSIPTESLRRTIRKNGYGNAAI